MSRTASAPSIRGLATIRKIRMIAMMLRAGPSFAARSDSAINSDHRSALGEDRRSGVFAEGTIHERPGEECHRKEDQRHVDVGELKE